MLDHLVRRGLAALVASLWVGFPSGPDQHGQPANAPSSSAAANAIEYEEVEADVPATAVPSPDEFDTLLALALRTRDAKTAVTGGQGAIIASTGSIAACRGPFNFGRSKVLVNPPGIPFYAGGGTQGSVNYRADSREIAATRHAYLGESERDDDLVSGFAVIRRGDKHEWILLDVFRKEFYSAAIGGSSIASTAEAPQNAARGSTSESLDAAAHVQRVGCRSIGGLETDGYRITSVDLVAYASAFPAPVPPCAADERDETYAVPEERALAGVAAPASDDGQPKISDRLLVYVAQKTEGAHRGQFAHVLLRGHIRALFPGSASLFDVPNGYRRLANEPPHTIFEARERFAPTTSASP